MNKIILAAFIAFIPPAWAQADCTPLDPRASITTERDGKIRGAVSTLYKIAKAEGELQGKIKEEINNLQKGAGDKSERYLIAARMLYLFCTMVANAKDISTERKFQLFTITQRAIREEQANSPEILRGWLASSNDYTCKFKLETSPIPMQFIIENLSPGDALNEGWYFEISETDESLFPTRYKTCADVSKYVRGWLIVDGVRKSLEKPLCHETKEGISAHLRYIQPVSFSQPGLDVETIKTRYKEHLDDLKNADHVQLEIHNSGERLLSNIVSFSDLREKMREFNCPYGNVGRQLLGY